MWLTMVTEKFCLLAVKTSLCGFSAFTSWMVGNPQRERLPQQDWIHPVEGGRHLKAFVLEDGPRMSIEIERGHELVQKVQRFREGVARQQTLVGQEKGGGGQLSPVDRGRHTCTVVLGCMPCCDNGIRGSIDPTRGSRCSLMFGRNNQ